MINNVISREFNIDTACVEVKLADDSMVSIDCKFNFNASGIDIKFTRNDIVNHKSKTPFIC